jgi:hypothetical protein
MDIERLRKKRQLNVQEQNALAKEKIFKCALAYRDGEPRLVWMRRALLQKGVDPESGMLAQASSVPCGGREEAAYAMWVGADSRFFSIEATISMDTHMLISVDSFLDVTNGTTLDGHQKGQGKSFGCLALEVFNEIQQVARVEPPASSASQ